MAYLYCLLFAVVSYKSNKGIAVRYDVKLGSAFSRQLTSYVYERTHCNRRGRLCLYNWFQHGGLGNLDWYKSSHFVYRFGCGVAVRAALLDSGPRGNRGHYLLLVPRLPVFPPLADNKKPPT